MTKSPSPKPDCVHSGVHDRPVDILDVSIWWPRYPFHEQEDLHSPARFEHAVFWLRRRCWLSLLIWLKIIRVYYFSRPMKIREIKRLNFDFQFPLSHVSPLDVVFFPRPGRPIVDLHKLGGSTVEIILLGSTPPTPRCQSPPELEIV